jgi:GntR family transcriptional regulator
MNNPILRTSKIPLYLQLYELLRENITQGRWKVGDLIPPEPELIAQYSVSRTTVRQVLDMLVSEGLIYRQQGRGTFVSQPTLEQGLTRIVSFTEDMRQRGLESSTRVLFSGIVPAPAEAAAKLSLSGGDELVRLERLRLANGEPLSVEESLLSHALCPGILQYDFAAYPLRRTLEEKYGIRLARATQVIRAVASTPALSLSLGTPQRSPLLFIERISYSTRGQPVELLHIYFRGDRYALHNELQG